MINSNEKQMKLKEIILSQISTENGDELLKSDAEQFLASLEPEETEKIKQEIINEGLTKEDLQILCDNALKKISNHIQNKKRTKEDETANLISFETGTLFHQDLEGILNGLPFDLTFVDKYDITRYYNQPSRERLTPRTLDILNSSIYDCHSPQTRPQVQRILDGFRNGSREPTEGWNDIDGKKVLIQNIPITTPTGDYLGCLEVDLDVTRFLGMNSNKR